MSTEAPSIAQSQLDLYDFFSVLLPGVYLLITLIPFLPVSLPLGTVGSAVVLLVGGYTVGRAIHSAADTYDQLREIPSNRDSFVNILQRGDDDVLTSDMKNQFYGAAKSDSGLDLPYDRTDAEDDDLSALYVYVRSQLYQHGNVRSQSFQAIYAFYRSAHFATVIAVLCYVVYALGQAVGYWAGIGDYSTYIGGLNLATGDLLLAAEIIFGISLVTFLDAKSDYREYYLQYLITDYVSVTHSPP